MEIQNVDDLPLLARADDPADLTAELKRMRSHLRAANARIANLEREAEQTDMELAMLRREQGMWRDAINREKTARAREAAEEERRRRAEAHRLRALAPLSERLARVVFDYAEHAEGRVLVRDRLATRLHGELLRSGLLHKYPRDLQAARLSPLGNGPALRHAPIGVAGSAWGLTQWHAIGSS